MKCKAGWDPCSRCNTGKTNMHGPAPRAKPAAWRGVAAAVWDHVGIRITREQATNIAKQLKENSS